MNPTKSENDGYPNLARNIPLFYDINALPIKFDPARFDAGCGIEANLREKRAKYHHSCRLLFSNTKLKRAEKRLAQEDLVSKDEGSRSKIPRKAQTSTSQCFLCEGEGGGLEGE